MPRTVEHIVATHEAARRLREAGKDIWDKTIDVQSILEDFKGTEDAEQLAECMHRVAKLIRMRAPAEMFDISNPEVSFDFVDTIEEMEQCTAASIERDAKYLDDDNSGVVNNWLEVVWDWGDENRIWLRSNGPSPRPKGG